MAGLLIELIEALQLVSDRESERQAAYAAAAESSAEVHDALIMLIDGEVENIEGGATDHQALEVLMVDSHTHTCTLITHSSPTLPQRLTYSCTHPQPHPNLLTLPLSPSHSPFLVPPSLTPHTISLIPLTPFSPSLALSPLTHTPSLSHHPLNSLPIPSPLCRRCKRCWRSSWPAWRT